MYGLTSKPTETNRIDLAKIHTMKSLAFSSSLKRVFLSASAASLLFGASHAFGQVNGAGPSDPSLFDNVINVPGDPIPNNFVSGNTQVNLSNGGVINFARLDLGSGVEFNSSGGTVNVLVANDESEVNVTGGDFTSLDTRRNTHSTISGGTLDRATLFGNFSVSSGVFGNGQLDFSSTGINPGTSSISGGSFGRLSLSNSSQGNVELVGGEFLLNGAEYLDSQITISAGDVFSGTLADGSAFIFSRSTLNSNRLDSLTAVTLTRVALPTINTTPLVIDAPAAGGTSLRSGQTLTLRDGGELINFKAVDATFNLEGGTLRNSNGLTGDADLSGGVANISGGNTGTDLRTTQGNILNLTGGTIGTGFASNDSTVNVSGGTIDIRNTFINSTVNVEDGQINAARFRNSDVNITGGTFTTIPNNFLDNTIEAFESNINISGGLIGSSASLFENNVANISGGRFDENFTITSNNEVNISGGVFGNGVRFNAGSDVELIGGEFNLNGTAFTGSTISLSEGDIFTGVFQDGSAFIFSDLVDDRLTTDVNLTTVAISEPTSNNFIVNSLDPVEAPLSIRAGQTLSVVEGGSISNTFESVGGTINVSGGSLESVTTTQGLINLSGGEIDTISVLNDGQVDVSDGSIGEIFLSSSNASFTGNGTSIGNVTAESSQLDFQDVTVEFASDVIASDSVINISGNTTINAELDVSNSEINISENASLTANFSNYRSSQINISGGNNNGFNVSDSTVRVTGGITDLVADTSQITITGGSIEGTTPIRFVANETILSGGSIADSLEIFGGTLDVQGGQIGDFLRLDPSVVASPGTINVSGGEIGVNFQASGDSIVNVSGGRIGEDFRVGSTANISDGIIGNNMFVGNDGIANISGGTIGSNFIVLEGTANISGGEIGNGFSVREGGTANISGGTIGSLFTVEDGSVANISGGTIGTDFDAVAGSEINFFASEFFIDGDAVVFSDFETSVLITERDFLLSGVYLDGSEFEYEVGRLRFNDFFVSSNATLRLNLVATSVPEPCAAILLTLSGMMVLGKRRRV